MLLCCDFWYDVYKKLNKYGSIILDRCNWLGFCVVFLDRWFVLYGLVGFVISVYEFVVVIVLC